MSDQRRIPLTEAARRLGISNTTIRRIVSDGRLVTHDNPLDKRQKLVDEAAVEELARKEPHMLNQVPGSTMLRDFAFGAMRARQEKENMRRQVEEQRRSEEHHARFEEYLARILGGKWPTCRDQIADQLTLKRAHAFIDGVEFWLDWGVRTVSARALSARVACPRCDYSVSGYVENTAALATLFTALDRHACNGDSESNAITP